jgi:hypothetical protein
MALYEHDCDTLEDILYRSLQDLWAPLTNVMKDFDTHGSDQQMCAQKPVKVLKKAGLRHETQADWHSGDAVHALYMASQRFMPQTLHTDSESASDDDASDEQPALVDSDPDAR